jgi:peptidoglycan/LPS O-acetylase OafA/YrhL
MTSQLPPTEEHKLGVLDGLRGLMAFWVLLGHTCILTAFHVRLLDSPGFAVNGFMVLSGFLMTYHYILRQNKEPWSKFSTWKAFWTRRFFRVSPLYYLLLIPCLVFMPKYAQWRTQLDSLHGMPARFAGAPAIDASNVALHVTYIFGLLPKYCSSLVLPDWSLSLEMQFYFVFPLLMLLVLRSNWLTLVSICSCIYAAAHVAHLTHLFAQPSPLYISILWFLIGMLWASHYFEREKRNRYAWAGVALSLLSLSPVSVVLISAFAICIFVDKPYTRQLREFLSGRVGKFLADASFSVYLVHLLILTPLAFYICTATQWRAPIRFLVAASATACISYALSIPLQEVEQYGHRIGKKLALRV